MKKAVMKKAVMKKILCVLPLFWLLGGCGNTNDNHANANHANHANHETANTDGQQAEATQQDESAQQDELTEVKVAFIASETGNEPLNFRDERGDLQGFEYDVLQEIAKRSHHHFVYSYQPRQNLFESLADNKFDMVVGSIAITDDRRKQYAMSNPYLEVYPVTIISKDKNIKALHQLKDKHVAIKDSSMDTLYDIVTQKKQEEELNDVQYMRSDWLAVQSVLSNKAEAAISDSSVIPYYVEKYSEKKSPLYFAIDYDYPQELYGFVLNKSDSQLLEEVNASLADMKADGTYQSIYKKWF